MSEVSAANVLVFLGAGAYLVGRKDLPKACRFVGGQLGRVVGLLQGARARADRFAVDNEMRALQSELRAGLRELDAVKSELAVATSSQMFGRELQQQQQQRRRQRPGSGQGPPPPPPPVARPTTTAAAAPGSSLLAADPSLGDATNDGSVVANHGVEYLEAAIAASEAEPAPPNDGPLAPRERSVAAVAEEEWERRGIGFTSRAEMGATNALGAADDDGPSSSARGGSILLEDVLRQTLIHDQYDRVVREQDAALRRRADEMLAGDQSAADDDDSKNRRG